MEVPQTSRLMSGERRLDTTVSDPDPLILRSRGRGGRLGQLDARQVGTWSILVLCALVLTIYAGSLAINSAVRWLHGQAEFQVKFREIELVPAPPVWFVGGTERFLERVRRDANETELIPVLDDPRSERVLLAFSKFAWVKRVERILYPSRRIRVQLEYYEPVAMLRINPVDRVALDEAGHVLPIDDVDLKRRPLILIVSKGLNEQGERKPGLLWKSGDDSRDRGILHAARLAGFLMDPERRAFTDKYPGTAIDRIDTENPKTGEGDRLWITNRLREAVQWGNAPGDEGPGEPTAVTKWEAYCRFLIERASKADRGMPKSEQPAKDR